LNDKIADGRDVSWIWDAEFEKLAKISPSEIFIGGTRAEDMLLRLKYVYGSARQVEPGLFLLGDKIKAHLLPKPGDLVKFIEQTGNGGHYYVVHTYTAMLTLRKYLLGRSLDEN
jgi:UDP-N-acetylmuramyl tripeptide synthase